MDANLWREKLAEEDRQLEERQRSLVQRVAHLQAELQEVAAERAVIRRWQQDPPGFVAQFSLGAPDARADPFLAGPSPMEGVDQLVAEEPGIQRIEAIDRLERVVESNSPNVRSILSSSISRRVKQRRIWQSEEERLWPWGHPDAQYQRHEQKQREKAEALVR